MLNCNCTVNLVAIFLFSLLYYYYIMNYSIFYPMYCYNWFLLQSYELDVIHWKIFIFRGPTLHLSAQGGSTAHKKTINTPPLENAGVPSQKALGLWTTVWNKVPPPLLPPALIIWIMRWMKNNLNLLNYRRNAGYTSQLKLTSGSLLALLHALAHKGWNALDAHTQPSTVRFLPTFRAQLSCHFLQEVSCASSWPEHQELATSACEFPQG